MAKPCCGLATSRRSRRTPPTAIIWSTARTGPAFVAIDNSEGEGDCHYPDADLIWNMGEERYTHKDGTPY